MSLTDPKPGGWALQERLTSTQVNALKTELLKAVDGTGGGNYSPSATIGISDLTVTGSNRLKYTSRSLVKPISLNPTHLGAWELDATASYLSQTSLGTTQVRFALDPPIVGTIASITAVIDGNSGHGGTLPSTMPRLRLFSRPRNSTSTTEIVLATDSSANTTIYEAVHSLTATANVVIDTTVHYQVGLAGEVGGSAVTGLTLLGLYATYTVTSQSEL